MFTITQLRSILPTTLAGIGALGLMISPTAMAQEIFSMTNLKPQYSAVKTGGPLEVHEGQCVPLVERLFFDCPGGKHSTCTAKIEVSTQYIGATPGWNVDIAAQVVAMNGTVQMIGPVSALAVASEVDRIWTANTASVTLVAKGLKRTSYWLDLCFYLVDGGDSTEPGFVHSGVRTVTVDVYKP